MYDSTIKTQKSSCNFRVEDPVEGLEETTITSAIGETESQAPSTSETATTNEKKTKEISEAKKVCCETNTKKLKECFRKY